MAFDKYESTDAIGDISFDERSNLDKAKDAIAPIFEKLKENRKIIAGIVIFLIIGYLLYDFFIGSYVTYTIEVKDTEGKTINAAVRIIGPDGKEAAKFSGSKDLSLKKGSYKADVTLTGYLPKTNQEFTVGSGNNYYSIILEKNIGVEITPKEEFPSIVLAGERIEKLVSLFNNSDEIEEVEIKYDFGSTKGITASTNPQTITIGPKQELIVTASLNIEKDAKPGEVNGEMRIKYTKKSIPINFEIKAFSESKVEFSTTSISDKSATVGRPLKKDFKIKNKNDVPLRNIEVIVEITNAVYCDKEKALEWFTIDPQFISEVPAKEGGKDGELPLQLTLLPNGRDLDIPAEAEKATLSGNILFKSTYMEKKLGFYFEVKKAKLDLEVSGLDSKYTAKYSDIESAYSADDQIEIKNTSNVELKNVRIGDFECKMNIEDNWQKSDYVSVTSDRWSSITPSNSQKTNLVIRVSPMEPDNKTIYCRGIISYDNPFFVPGSDDEPILYKQIEDFQIRTARN